MTSDTIFALSSGSPPAAIGIVRVSGPHAFAAAKAMMASVPPARSSALRQLCHPDTGIVLDRALVLRFHAPATATGEDLVELHLHGGRAVVTAVLDALGEMEGLRQAEPGEFTRRALMSGRIDLTEAEGLGDLLAAETETQRRVAIAAVEGSVGRLVGEWAARTVELSASMEALIDHSDEEDVGSGATADLGRLNESATALAAEIAEVLAEPPVERIRDGVRIVLAGPPNSGKSTLLNRLVGRDAAIVSPVAGTTRDRIEAPVRRGGLSYVITDTAGLRAESSDAIEAIGMDRARQTMAEADIILWLGDDQAPHVPGVEVIEVHSRNDQPGRELAPANRIGISAETGDNIPLLWNIISQAAQSLLPALDRPLLNARQRALCKDAHSWLLDAANSADILLSAECLRQARSAFDRVTGKADTEAMLDALFGRFCIGK